MEESIIQELQQAAEKEIGPMPTKRGEIPSLELLYKFYNFYLNKTPDNYNSRRNMILMHLCSQSKEHVIKVAKMHYNMDKECFLDYILEKLQSNSV